MKPAVFPVALGAALACVTLGAAQAPTTTTARETKTFQIISVDGNQLVVRLPEGTRELTVPSDFRFIVNDKPLGLSELKPGMTGTAAITTTTTVTPVTVTEIKNGTVFQASGGSIIIRTSEGFKSFHQSELDRRGIKILKNGKPVQLSALRVNDRLTAIIITTLPPQILSEKEVRATVPAAPAAVPPKTLPKTASPLPAVGLLGLTSLLAGLGLSLRRRRALR